MKKSKLLLPIYLTIALVFLITAVVVSLTAGVNLGVDFVGGKQIEVQMADDGQFGAYDSAVKSTLSAHNLSVDSSFTEGKYTHTYYVAKIRANEIADTEALEIRTEIADKLTINIENVGEILTISGNVKQKTVETVSIAISVVLVLLFVVAWIRYGIMNGLALLFNGLISLILSFALIFISRVQLNVSSCAGIFVSIIAGTMIFTSILEKVREASKSIQNKKDTREIYISSLKDTVLFGAMVFGGLVLFSLFAMFVSAAYIMFFALSTIISVIATVFSIVLSTELATKLEASKTEQAKQKLSKNNNSK